MEGAMSVNSRFAVSIHILAFLASQANEAATSEVIAGSVNTNPVVIRRVMGVLRKASIVTSAPGVGGGWQLAWRPETITLAEVYRVISDEPLFATHHRPPNPLCPIGGTVQGVIEDAFAEAETALRRQLAEKTIADILQETLNRPHAGAA